MSKYRTPRARKRIILRRIADSDWPMATRRSASGVRPSLNSAERIALSRSSSTISADWASRVSGALFVTLCGLAAKASLFVNQPRGPPKRSRAGYTHRRRQHAKCVVAAQEVGGRGPSDSSAGSRIQLPCHLQSTPHTQYQTDRQALQQRNLRHPEHNEVALSIGRCRGGLRRSLPLPVRRHRP